MLTGISASADTVTGIVKPLNVQLMMRHTGAAEMRSAATPEQGDTPVDRFFVRNHTLTPRIDADTWSLKLFGTGLSGRRSRSSPIEVNYADLLSMPRVTRRVLIECTGNGRTLFATQQGEPTSGTPWGLGAVGVASWTGVPLRVMLERAGVSASAASVLPTGLDPEYAEDGINHGRVRRPLPITKAMDDVLVAYAMNGEQLPADHGFPARLVVPNWVGIASIKWLDTIEVSTRQLESPWSTIFYNLGGRPLTDLVPKSVLELERGVELRAGGLHQLKGHAWSGAGPITKVELSANNGLTWRPARLVDDGPWTRWTYDWRPRRRGQRTILTRATDAAGNRQPLTWPYNPRGYLFGGVVRHPVAIV